MTKDKDMVFYMENFENEQKKDKPFFDLPESGF